MTSFPVNRMCCGAVLPDEFLVVCQERCGIVFSCSDQNTKTRAGQYSMMTDGIQVGESRERCYRCFRPKSYCFCQAIPQIDNRTNVLLLQHVGERFHPFNTARIVKESLSNCQMITDHNRQLGECNLPISDDAGLLFPKSDSPILDELPAEKRPSQLVIIDGTWHQAKTILRDVPQLQGLRCFRLAPTTPGQYKIRREPTPQSLSTLEATVSALKSLEPETKGLDQLLKAFHTMVSGQLGHPESFAQWRKKKSRNVVTRFLPYTLLHEPQRLVLAYGEATPGKKGEFNSRPQPVNWTAERLQSSERFSCCLRQETVLSQTSLQHMRLTTADFDRAVSVDEFRQSWDDFIDRRDVLVVYHDRTFQLLKNINAVQPRSLVLKSIFGTWQKDFRSLEELIELEGVQLPAPDGKSRAEIRLEMIVALVKNLRDRATRMPGR